MKYNILTIILLLGCIKSFSQSLATQQNTYAVVVGISDYQDEAIPDLQFADKDAMAFAGFLQSPAGGSLDEDHLKVLINEQATQAQFAGALDWLWEVVGENDKAIIYFSGHGDVEKKSLTQPGFLLCWDAPSRVYMAGGAFPLSMMQEVISTISIQNKAKVIMIADACRSGKLSGSKVGGAQLTNSNLAKQYANEIKILSCQPNEYSIEGEQWGGGRGAFSYHLLDGLYGLADEDENLNVNLKEIGRYLEDKVTEEVAPQSQNPMVIGSKTENITMVFPEILAQLKEGRKGQLQLFTTTESKGIEEEVLAAADSNMVELYFAFSQALEDKQFLKPMTACADFYYEKLSKESQLEKLHSSMRRNYAAALQDDAQQVMNTILKSGLTERILRSAKVEDIYKNYPAYLDRAGDLLGKEHYMYKALQARKHFFEGIIQKERKGKRLAYRKALSWQPEMAHAMVYLIRSFETEQVDSATFYTQKAAALIPSWVVPYLAMSDFYLKAQQLEKAEEMLTLAGQLDSTSVLVWYSKANFYRQSKKYKLAKKWYLKAIEKTGDAICFPCAHNNLAIVYMRIGQYDEAIKHINKAIQLDSTFVRAYNLLGSYYNANGQYLDAIKTFQKAIEFDSLLWDVHYNLGNAYIIISDNDKAEKHLKKAIEIDSTEFRAYSNLGKNYLDIKKYDLAEKYMTKAVQLGGGNAISYINLGMLYKTIGQFDKAEHAYKKAIQIDSTNALAYNNLGSFYIKNRRYQDVEHLLGKSLQLDSTQWLAYANLGLYFQTFQRWEESVPVMEKAIAFGPRIGVLVASLGNAYTHLPGRLEDAKTALDKALELSPNSPDTHIYFSQWLLKMKQPEQAWHYLELGLEKGIGKEGLTVFDLQEGPDFEEMRKDPKWDTILQKYFPEQIEKSK